MKGIFFWATVDIFWVMESWVTKKLLGPNGRAKTQFSTVFFPKKLEDVSKWRLSIECDNVTKPEHIIYVNSEKQSESLNHLWQRH